MSQIWQGQLAVITVEDESGTEIDVGLLQDIELAVEREVQELRGSGDDITWQDLFASEIAVTLSGEVQSWDKDAWNALVGYDEAAGELDTSPEVPTFSITAELTASDGTAFDAYIPEAYDDSLTIGGGRDEHIGLQIDARGNTVTDPPA